MTSKMPKENNHGVIVSEHEDKNVNHLPTKVYDAESNCPKNKRKPISGSHKRKPFACRVAIFDEKEDPNKKCMYPKRLVYADGKDIQLEEIRAMRYWNKVKGPELNDAPKITHEASTQTDPEPDKVIRAIETSTQTECLLVQNEEFVASVKSKITKAKNPPNQDSPNKNASQRIATRSLTRAKLTYKIPTISNLAKTTIKEESAILPLSNCESSNSNATFVVRKGKPTENTANLHPCRLNGEYTVENEESDDTVNTNAFKVVAASTPFQADKNKNNHQKDRRKAMKIELPIPMQIKMP